MMAKKPTQYPFFFDIETTGFDADKSSVLSISHGQDPTRVKSSLKLSSRLMPTSRIRRTSSGRSRSTTWTRSYPWKCASRKCSARFSCSLIVYFVKQDFQSNPEGSVYVIQPTAYPYTFFCWFGWNMPNLTIFQRLCNSYYDNQTDTTVENA